MSLGREFSEKLTHTLAATVICGVAATVGPAGAWSRGLVEALLGGAALTHNFFRNRSQQQFISVLRRCTADIEKASDEWIDSECRGDASAQAERDAAITAIKTALPLITPRPEELVAARLSKDRVASFYLARAASIQPEDFADKPENATTRRLLQAVIGKSVEVIARQPEFAADILRHSLAELLHGQDEIRNDIANARDDIGTQIDDIVPRLVAALDARGETSRAGQAGLERHVIIALAQRLQPEEVLDFEQAYTVLEGLVRVALDVMARGKRGSNLDVFIEAVLAEVAEKTKVGDFDAGARAVDAALAELERQEAEQRAIRKQSRIALLDAGIRQDILRRDALAVARRIETLCSVEQDAPASASALRGAYDAFYGGGYDQGINFQLLVAIELARRMIALARDASERNVGFNRLGTTLARLGEREGGLARFEEAVGAFDEVLKGTSREQTPLEWAMAQNNLGTALKNLGEREREGGTERLKRAVEALCQALKERTRERVPDLWATTRNNLGNAFVSLARREGGTARLKKAVIIFGEVLEVWTRERTPLKWAMAQNNLGTALMRLAVQENGTGAAENGTARLKLAITAFRAAMKVWTRERMPARWAEAQFNLGNALRELGVRESGTARENGTARLEEAVGAFDEALTVLASDDHIAERCRNSRKLALQLLRICKIDRSS